MGKDSTLIGYFDELRNINISKLIEWNYLKKNQIKNGTIYWGKNSVDIEVNTFEMYLQISYTYRETTQVNYKVNIVSIPSNLGKGEILYFQCPVTNKNCRKLYYISGKFLHREAAKHYYFYKKQTYSKKDRLIDKYFHTDSIYEKRYKKYFKTHYKGKPTKRYIRLSKQIEQTERIPYKLAQILLP